MYILSTYDHGVVLHMKVCHDIIVTEELLPLTFDRLKLVNLFHALSKLLIKFYDFYSEYSRTSMAGTGLRP